MTHDEIRELIRTNGWETEALSCIEELSELQKEITKAMRNKNGDRYAESNIDDMISEIADVLITIDILKLLFHIHIFCRMIGCNNFLYRVYRIFYYVIKQFFLWQIRLSSEATPFQPRDKSAFPPKQRLFNSVKNAPFPPSNIFPILQ